MTTRQSFQVVIFGDLQISLRDRSYIDAALKYLAVTFESPHYTLLLGIEPMRQLAPGISGLAMRVVQNLDNWSIKRVPPTTCGVPWYSDETQLNKCGAIFLIGGPSHIRDTARRLKESNIPVFEVAAHHGKIAVFDHILQD